MNEGTKDFVASCTTILHQVERMAVLPVLAVFFLLFVGPAAGWAQGLPLKRCTSSGATIQAYLCLDDIVVVDGSGYNGAGAPTGTQVCERKSNPDLVRRLPGPGIQCDCRAWHGQADCGQQNVGSHSCGPQRRKPGSPHEGRHGMGIDFPDVFGRGT